MQVVVKEITAYLYGAGTYLFDIKNTKLAYM